MSVPANSADLDISRRASRRKPGRAPTSCAECRRLKAKCDRQVPCNTCLTKGCAEICPDGIRSAMRMGRTVDAVYSNALKEEVVELKERVHLLELALAELQALVSDDPHPLLVSQSQGVQDATEEEVADPAELSSGAADSPPTLSEKESFVNAFGLLTLGPSGETTFLGRGSRSEYLILDCPPSTKSSTDQKHTLPRISASPRIREAARRVLEPHFIDSELGEDVYALLPPLEEAHRLCEHYMHKAKYIAMPITRQELFDTYLYPVYHASSYAALGDPHLLSVVLSVFAHAALDDPALQTATELAQEYYALAWIAVYCTFPPRAATMPLVETLLNLAYYEELEGRELHDPWRSWTTTGMAVRFGHSIGLHLSASRWNLSDDAVRRRQRLCRSLFNLDTFVSSWCGRPPSMSIEWTDLGLNGPGEGYTSTASEPSSLADVNEKSEKWEEEYQTWLTKYTLLMRAVMKATSSIRLPTYALILGLDRRIREFYIPPDMRVTCYLTPEERAAVRPETVIRRHGSLTLKESLLLTLHRSYFGQALADSPNDLRRHRFAPSVVASYRSAWRLIRAMHMPLTLATKETYQLGVFWSHLVSAAVVMSHLAIKAPSSPLTPSALAELDAAMLMFAHGALSSRAAAHYLKMMQPLQRKAHDAVRGLYEHSARDQREIDRLNDQTQLLLHDGATLIDVASAPPLSPSVFAATAASTDPGPKHDQTAMPWKALGNPSMSTVPTDLPEVTMTDLLHPTVASDMRVFDANLLAPTTVEIATTEPWDNAHSGSEPIVPLPNMNANQPWDNYNAAFAVAAGTTVHSGQSQDQTTSTHDMYYDNHDPLSFMPGVGDNLFGFSAGAETANLDQLYSNEEVATHDVVDQASMAHAGANPGNIGHQQQGPMQPRVGEESWERAEFERAWQGFMMQLGLSNARTGLFRVN